VFGERKKGKIIKKKKVKFHPTTGHEGPVG
jgi:hypothetical protein